MVTWLGLYVLDDNGSPVACEDVTEWGRWLATPGNRQLANDEVNGVRISTVFLGIDHNFYDGPPLLWETLVFGGALDGEGGRYESRAEALAGHALMVARVLASEELAPEEFS